MTPTMPKTDAYRELPDEIRVPLHEVWADLPLLFARSASEGHETAILLAESQRIKLSALEAALLTAIRQLASAPVAVPAELRVLSERASPDWCIYSEPEVGLPSSLFSGQVGHADFGPVEPLQGWDLAFVVAAINDLRSRIAAEDARQIAISDSMQGFLASCRPHGAVSDAGSVDGKVKSYSHREAVSLGYLCDDCPPPGYPTDETRCAPCPARAAPLPPVGEKAAADATTMGQT